MRIGITGHRLNKLPPDGRDRVRQELGRVLALIDGGLDRSSADGSGRPKAWIVSALAEGADRLAVEAAPAGWSLAAVLPMPRAEYERDFVCAGQDTSPSRDAFRAALSWAASLVELPFVAEARRDQHYGALGSYLVRHVDLLIAVWDGRAAEGPGGTATVVAGAVARGLDLIHVDPADPSRTRLVSGFVEGDIARPVWSALDGPALDDVLRRRLGAAHPTEGGSPPDPSTIAEARAAT